MRKLRTAVLAGVAALCVAGTAMAASKQSHVMAVALPDGSIARIAYRGDVAPQVRVVPVDLADSVEVAPFAMFDRILAAMDAQAAAMSREAAMLDRAPAEAGAMPDLAAFGDLPDGTVSYRMVSTSDGSHVCTRSWRMVSQGAGQQPKLISASSGDCAGIAAPAASDKAPPPSADPPAPSHTVAPTTA